MIRPVHEGGRIDFVRKYRELRDDSRMIILMPMVIAEVKNITGSSGVHQRA